MSRPQVKYAAIERGIQKVTRTYDDGRMTTAYRIKYADATGTVQARTIHGNLKQARSELAAQRVAVTKGKHVTHSDGSVRFLAVAEEWLEMKLPDWKPRTAQSNQWTVESKLLPLHNVRMKDLNHHAVVSFRAELSRPKANGDRPAPSSVQRTMGVLSQICDYARKCSLINENPCNLLDPVRGRKPDRRMPSTDDVERLIAFLSSPTPERRDSRGRRLKERPADPRYALLVEVAAYSGLRAGELAGLQVRDINFEARSVRVQRTIAAVASGQVLDTPKSDAGRRTVTGLDADVIERLRVHCVGMRQTDFVFGSRGKDGVSRPMHHGNIYKRIIKPAAEELGIDMTFHGLRHHYASLLIDLGLSPVEVAAQLGHESAAFTLRTYAHLFDTKSTDVGDQVAARRREARGEDAKVVPLRAVAGDSRFSGKDPRGKTPAKKPF